MNRKSTFLLVMATALFLLANDLVGSAQAKSKLVKVGGQKNQCECTYRIE